MSVKVMSLIWEVEALASNEKIVLLALADHANDDGGDIFPSMERVARKCSLSKRQARRVVGELRTKGWLEIVREAGQHRPTEYRIPVDSLPHLREDNMASLENPGRTPAHPGGTSATSREDTGDPLTIKNHQEPSISPKEETVVVLPGEGSSDSDDLAWSGDYEVPVDDLRATLAAIGGSNMTP